MASTLQDIADRAGVSRMTASLVLNSRQFHRVSAETRQRVEQIAEELSYRPNLAARQLSGKRSGMLGLLMPRNARDYAFHRLQAIDQEVMGRGYHLMAGHVSPTDDSLQIYCGEFRARGVEGLIWLGHSNFAETHLAKVLEQFPATVLVGLPVAEGSTCVLTDYAQAIQEVVEYLAGRGRRAVAMACNESQWLGNRQRMEGYRRTMKPANSPTRPALLWQRVTKTPAESQPDRDAVDQIVHSLAVEERADAIIANNDLWAAEIIKGLRRRGLRVPEDVAVVGQDNSELAQHFDPPITSLDLQPILVAQCAADLLLATIAEGPLPAERRTVSTALKLVPRQSTGD